jgi:hypothetical protein
VIGPGIALVIGAIALFGLAAWFGMVCIAPRIGRAMDRAEQREEPRDGAD